MKKIFLLLAMVASIFSILSEVEAASSNVKVGFIFLHNENSTYDANFMNAAKIQAWNIFSKKIFLKMKNVMKLQLNWRIKVAT